MKALGMIEVYGFLPAVEALDSALKAANVSLMEVTKVTGGLVSVLVTGDVGAVKAAILAAAEAASKVGQVVSVHVIPRPAKELEKIVIEAIPERPRASKLEEPTKEDKATLTEAELLNMTVVNLRSLARELGLNNMTKQDIRFARKKELINAILKQPEQYSKTP